MNNKQAAIRNVCVFASSSKELKQPHYDYAYDLGARLARENINMIFGGGAQGLMGATADGILEHGGRVIGIIPEKLHQPGVAHEKVHELIVTKTMHERKAEMELRADGFLILPGGFGTLEEALEVITLKQLGYHEKPIVFCNAQNFYSSLFLQFEAIFDGRFADAAFRALYDIVDTPEAAIRALTEYRPGAMPEKLLGQYRTKEGMGMRSGF